MISLKNSASTIIYADAKKALEKLDYIDHKVICLSTMYRLINPSKDLAIDADIDEAWTLKTLSELLPKVEELKLEALLNLECELIPHVVLMQKHGLPFKKEIWTHSLENIHHKLMLIKKELAQYLRIDTGFELFGTSEIDLNQPELVKNALEKLLGQKIHSTSQKSLKYIDHPAIKLLISYREHMRMLSAYGQNFLAKIINDRLIGNFMPLGTSSGRMSCQNPNLQALPSAPEFQRAIVAPLGRTLLHFDYAGFELRILAALSQDKNLLSIFNSNEDIHSMVAREIFKTTKVSKSENQELREQAKVLNFGIVYGMQEQALARTLNISLNKASTMMIAYFRRFTKVKDFLLALEKKALDHGYVNTRLGRRIYFDDMADENKAHLLRVARNMPIQGTGADIAKLALCMVSARLQEKQLDAFLVNMVHDELVLECAIDIKDEVIRTAQSAMKDAFLAILPELSAEVSVSEKYN